ncbi:MAG: hypothetical protein COA45_10695 [Zetaproteobacteria bacterium]|nr:MAG: hypothetical protein COA45_10695 [Zetaproteobacteria bacterium]
MADKSILIDQEQTGLSGDELANALIAEMKEDPETALKFCHYYIEHVPEEVRVELLTTLAKENPDIAFHAIGKHDGNWIMEVPWSQRDDVIMDIAKDSSSDAILYAAQSLDHYFLSNSETSELVKEAVKDVSPETILLASETYAKYLPKDEYTNIIKEAVQNDPYNALKNTDSFVQNLSKQEAKEILEGAVTQLDQRIQVAPSISYNNKSLHQILGEERISGTKNDINNNLTVAFELNELHDEPDDVRFASINDHSASQLLDVMVLGREEVYTSTFLGVFDRFQEKMAAEGKDSVLDVANPKYSTMAVSFLEIANSYNKLDEAMAFIPKDQWGSVLETVSSEIENGNTGIAISLADIMNNTSDPAIKAQIEQHIQNSYDNAPPGSIKDTYAVTAAYYNDLSGQDTIKIENPDHYKVAAVDSLSQDELVGTDGIHKQLLVFTGDEDGVSSFEYFQKRFEQSKDYKVEDKGDYIKITSLSGETPIEIYANHPDASPDTILQDISGKPDATIKDVEFDSVIHRGHSYNLDNTLPYFSESNSLVFLGSCGGYSNVEKLMDIAPDAQIIATKQVGTKFINDPMIFDINESIRKGEPLVWEDKQKVLDGFGDPRKESYVLPDKNTPLIFAKKLKELEDERNEQSTAPSVQAPAQDMDANTPNGVTAHDDLSSVLPPDATLTVQSNAPSGVALVSDVVPAAQLSVINDNGEVIELEQQQELEQQRLFEQQQIVQQQELAQQQQLQQGQTMEFKIPV